MSVNEKTGPQLTRAMGVATSFDGPMSLGTRKSAKTYKTYREMRNDPTISLARFLSAAPILVSDWSIQTYGEPADGSVKFVQEQILPLRLHVLRTAVLGCIDFGWQAYEKVWDIDDNGRIVLKKLKPLLQDITEILISDENGAFSGLKQTQSGEDVILEVSESLLLNQDVEGTDWYGQPTMEIARKSYDKWEVVEDASDRYDRKIAGSHWVVHYPLGSSMIDGNEMDNFEVAKRLLRTLQSSGSITVPRKVQNLVDELNADSSDAWKIEILSDSGSARASFIDRAKYLDALKVRAFGLPERAVLEGQFGTKAEAEAHADLAIVHMELRHQLMAQQINWHLINQLIRLNWGRKYENTVYVQPAPIADLKLAFLRQLYTSILANPDGFASESIALDVTALRERLGVPTKATEEGVSGVIPDFGALLTDDPIFVRDASGV